jgi:hypothetical protein
MDVEYREYTEKRGQKFYSSAVLRVYRVRILQ